MSLNRKKFVFRNLSLRPAFEADVSLIVMEHAPGQDPFLPCPGSAVDVAVERERQVGTALSCFDDGVCVGDLEILCQSTCPGRH